MYKLIVFASGEGTNLQAIIEACKNNVLDAKVILVISNNENSGAKKKASSEGIPIQIFKYNSKEKKRNEYDGELANFIKNYEFNLIILAGWMHILSSSFLKNVITPIINLHPALPGKFPGKNSIEDAYLAFKNGIVKNTGIMVHHVIEEIDAGNIIEQMEIPIYNCDTLETLRNRIRYFEKFVLIKAIDKIIHEKHIFNNQPIYILEK